MDARTSPIRLRLTQLREVLAREGVHALLVPSADPHLSEYLPEHWQGRQWLSGFTGSMATLVVAVDRAALFADSRYWVQAEAELAGTGIELVKIPTGSSPAHTDWLVRHVPRGAVVAVDGMVLGLAAAGALKAALEAAGVALRTDIDLLDALWPERPALPAAPVYEHAAPHATQPRSARLAAVREAMAGHGATHHFVSTVDDVAWITNLRGSDVPYNPVFLAHLLLDGSGGTLFVGAGKVTRRWPPPWPPTACAWRRMPTPARHSPRWAAARACWSTPGASRTACARKSASAASSSRPSTRARC